MKIFEEKYTVYTIQQSLHEYFKLRWAFINNERFRGSDYKDDLFPSSVWSLGRSVTEMA